jgi:hypothetical protein
MVTPVREAKSVQSMVTVRRQAAETAQQESAMMEVTAEDIRAKLEARLQSALETARASYKPEVAEPLGWWEIYAIGPIQPGAQLVPPASFLDSPLSPDKVIRKGEKAYIATVVIINPCALPQDPNINPTSFLTPFGLPLEVEYHTANVTDVTKGPASMNVTHSTLHLLPNVSYYVDVLEFDGDKEGCIYETNICARILDCSGKTPSASPFAAFARTTINIDEELFLPSQVLEFDNPVRFMVYE